MDPLELLGEEYCYKGERISVKIVRFRKNSSIIEREVVEFGEAVAILPILEDGRIVLIKQYRPALNKWILEVPAGRVEPGEKPFDAALRELVEETGYRAGEIERIASVCPAPGYSDEIIHIYVARKLKYVGSKPEEYEAIERIEMDLDSAMGEVERSDLIDAKTFISLAIFKSKYYKSCSRN